MKLDFTKEELEVLLDGLYAAGEFVFTQDDRKPIDTLIERIESILQ